MKALSILVTLLTLSSCAYNDGYTGYNDRGVSCYTIKNDKKVFDKEKCLRFNDNIARDRIHSLTPYQRMTMPQIDD